MTLVGATPTVGAPVVGRIDGGRRFTVAAKFWSLVTVILEVPCDPWDIVRDAGLADSLKSWTRMMMSAIAPRYVVPVNGVIVVLVIPRTCTA